MSKEREHFGGEEKEKADVAHDGLERWVEVKRKGEAELRKRLIQQEGRGRRIKPEQKTSAEAAGRQFNI